MSKITGLLFHVKSPTKLASWYERVLGMSVNQISEDTVDCQYQSQDLKLQLRKGGEAAQAGGMSVYWKIGIGLEDVALGRKKIIEKGTQVSEPHQFHEIGFLCHLKDEAGNSLELLQDAFEKNFVAPAERPEMALGQPGKIGQITIRSSNIEKTLALYEKALGMKMLSIQEVAQYGFTLYFLAYTDETPPNAGNLEAVENREWLWQRPYTTLEIQYKNGFELAGLNETAGVGEMELTMSSDPRDKLRDNNISFKEEGNGGLMLKDHDGFKINIKY